MTKRHHRYYDPTTTQYLTPDPLHPITGERYGYTTNDPINGDDPLGLLGCGFAWLWDCPTPAEQLQRKASKLSRQIQDLQAEYRSDWAGIHGAFKFIGGLAGVENCGSWSASLADAVLSPESNALNNANAAYSIMMSAHSCLINSNNSAADCGQAMYNGLVGIVTSIPALGLGPAGKIVFDTLEDVMEWSANSFNIAAEAIKNGGN